MSHNPHNLCTWNEEGDCRDCELEGKLNCRWRGSHLVGFFSIMIGALSIAAEGLYPYRLDSWKPVSSDSLHWIYVFLLQRH